PHSGLNNTPALVLASNFIWRLAESVEAQKRNDFLRSNDHSEGNEISAEIAYDSDPRFQLSGRDFEGRVRQSATAGTFNLVVERGQEDRTPHLQHAISGQSAADAWRVLGSSAPGGVVPRTEVDHTASF